MTISWVKANVSSLHWRCKVMLVNGSGVAMAAKYLGGNKYRDNSKENKTVSALICSMASVCTGRQIRGDLYLRLLPSDWLPLLFSRLEWSHEQYTRRDKERETSP